MTLFLLSSGTWVGSLLETLKLQIQVLHRGQRLGIQHSEVYPIKTINAHLLSFVHTLNSLALLTFSKHFHVC